MRLAVLSNERLNPWINWSTLGPPLLDPLARQSGGLVLAPPPLAIGHFAEWARTIKAARTADTLFWIQGSARPELPLTLASLACPSARRAAYVIDAWTPLLTKIGIAAVAQGLDPCFVAYRDACHELKRRFPRGRFEWLPFGVDTDTFASAGEERDVFAFWMGRRYEPLHIALSEYCRKRGLAYHFTQRAGEFNNPRDLGRFVARSRYFVVTPPDLDNPKRTGGLSPLVMRYLEGLSAGARLLGVLPRSGEYEALLPRDAILEVAPDGSDLAERLDADRENETGWAAVVRAQALVRAEHSWTRRAEQIRLRLASNQPVEIFGTGSPEPRQAASG